MVDLIVPVLDERDALPWLLSRLPDGVRAIVVDNGSTDGSGDVARSLGALVVPEPRRGFGAACWAGLMAAEADVVCFMDGDGSLDPTHLPRTYVPVLSGQFDLVWARRIAGRGAWQPHARLANRWLARRLRQEFGWAVRDLGPMRSARREALLALGMRDRRSGWPLEMALRAGNAGWRVAEVAAPYRPRVGRSKVTGTARGTVIAVGDMRRQLRELT